MAIKCVLVDIDNVLITEIVEVMSEEGEPDCRLINPYRFFEEGDMKPWLKASNQTEFMLRSEDILTIADPTPEVVQQYKDLTA